MSEIEDTSEMTKIEQRADWIPFEIRNAVEAFAGKKEQAIAVTLLEEGQMAFSEIESDLDIHSQNLTNALDELLAGGLIRKRSDDNPANRYSAYYEMTEYGERFVDCLLGSLGTVDSGNRPETRVQQIEHIHNSQTQNPVEVVDYTSDEPTKLDENAATQQ